jgi:hypothetical protein
MYPCFYLSTPVPQKVLRSYDSRFRETERSPAIYLDTQCKDLVGGDVSVVEKSPAEDCTEVSVCDDDSFWTSSSTKHLEIIALPYKNGKHNATRPTDFIRIIDQLEKLHSLGYVHGDIRAFNVLFGDEGSLIDFDFGGIPGKAYPQGYQQFLSDGWRLGTGDSKRKSNKLQFYHDWFALGGLMFHIHDWNVPPNASDASRLRFFELRHKWSNLDSTPTPAEIENLKEDLIFFDQHWTVSPSILFAEDLARFQEQK